MFPTTTYTSRREQLATNFTSGILLFPGNENSPMNYHANVYTFRQDSNFLYYFGMDQTGLAAIIDIDEKETIIYGNENTLDDVVWTGPLPTIKDQAASVGVNKTLPYKEIEAKLSAAIANNRTIHFLPVYRADKQIKLAAWLGKTNNEIREGSSDELIHAVIKQRSYKTAEEIVQLEEAVNTTRKMHVAAMRVAKPGMKESNLAGLVKWQAIAGGGDLAYGVILTVNGQTLHNHHHHNVMKEGQLVLGDFGAENSMHYAGDITRTFPVSAKFTDQQKDIYNIVLASQIAAIDALKPGVSYQSIHLLSAKVITEGLKALGLMKGDVDEAVKAGAHALFFPHGLGHMIGLDVHDMEDLGEDHVGYDNEVKRSDQFGTAYLRLGRKLEAGFVLTVEPGIYFIPELIDQWREKGTNAAYINFDKLEAYKDFGGIRIEDNLLITDTGSQLLGEPIPKTVEEIEAIRALAFVS